MASDLASVSGYRTGRTSSSPRANASATGAHPTPWAPETRTSGCSSSSLTMCSSRNALPTRVSNAPDAIGTTTWSGARQPSCSAVSYAMVLDPSA